MFIFCHLLTLVCASLSAPTAVQHHCGHRGDRQEAAPEGTATVSGHLHPPEQDCRQVHWPSCCAESWGPGGCWAWEGVRVELYKSFFIHLFLPFNCLLYCIPIFFLFHYLSLPVVAEWNLSYYFFSYFYPFFIFNFSSGRAKPPVLLFCPFLPIFVPFSFQFGLNYNLPYIYMFSAFPYSFLSFLFN